VGRPLNGANGASGEQRAQDEPDTCVDADLETTGLLPSRRLPQPTTESIALVTVLAALGDPVRLQIMQVLYRRKDHDDWRVMSDAIGVSHSNISHHLRILREAGLTSTAVEGRRRHVDVRVDDLEKRFPGMLASILAAD
jgi:DNA-binding transcriptional ArsR family regulator